MLFAPVLPLFAVLFATEKLSVILPDKENLQYMPFWVARGAGFFEKEGVELEPIVATEPIDAERLVRRAKAPLAVLPPPMYVKLIAEKVPIVLVANLLANDPIDLVVAKEVIAARKLERALPLVDRLRALKGLRLGVAPHPVTRLRALFDSVGLDPKDWIEIVIVPGKEQNAAFADKKVDALYCHTPFLEKAVVDQGAEVWVDQAGGEVPVLANRQIHALVASSDFVRTEPEKVKALVRAIARAIDLIRTDEKAAVLALEKALPNRPKTHIEAIVRLYRGAVPKTPEVTAGGLESARLFFPAGSVAPSFTGIDLRAYLYAPAK